jgi:hypothetical protein
LCGADIFDCQLNRACHERVVHVCGRVARELRRFCARLSVYAISTLKEASISGAWKSAKLFAA